MKTILVLIIALLLASGSFSVGAVSTSAKAAALIGGDTGELIYAQNADECLPMASTTKIMSALLLCEYGNFDEPFTVTEEMVRVEGSSMGLLAGDTVTPRDLLYGMLLASGNDAANTTAYLVDGAVSDFVARMNRKATEIGLKNTHFVTPSGLDAEEHYTTAYELALLARYALLNEEFAKACASSEAVLCYGNPPYRRRLTNHNKLLKQYDGLIGVKTGFTKKSGRCLVTAAERDGKRVIAVTLNDPNDWEDHKAMLDFGFSKLKTIELIPPENSYTVGVIGGEKDFLTFEPTVMSISTVNDGAISAEVFLPNFVYAPIAKGEKLGEIVYYCDGEILKTVSLCSSHEIKVKSNSKINELWSNFKYIIATF